MSAPRLLLPVLGLAALAACALTPAFGGGYAMSMVINLLMFAVMATAWAMFCGPCGYVSLATAAFFGVGAYSASVFGEAMPWPLVLCVAAAVGLLLALAVGLATLRLRGIYFVIFSFGLAELIRQLTIWSEAKGGSVGRYLFLDITQSQIVWQLCGLALATFVIGALIQRSRLGLALRMIGDDEVAAQHCGVNTTAAKLAVFAVSSMLTALVGAIVAPRWTYLDPNIAFNPVISFQVLIMALLGGASRLHGPVLGVLPMVLLSEYLSANHPNYFSILLGITFMAIVYVVPRGVVGWFDGLGGRRRHRATAPVAAAPAASVSTGAAP